MKKENLIILGVALIFIVGGGLLFLADNPGKSPVEKELQGEEQELQGATHIETSENFDAYNSNPPTSGPHYSSAASRSFYEEILADEQLVHNLEHGEIWISYKDIDQETLDELRRIQSLNRGSVIVTNRPANDNKIAVTSWGRLMTMEDIDFVKIQSFIDANKNNSPEPLAR